MCILKDLPEIGSKTKSPARSPWRRHLKEPMKPKLSRKITSSAKINLNLYWSRFEDQAASMRSSQSTKIIPSIELIHTTAAIDTEINERLANDLSNSALGNNDI